MRQEGNIMSRKPPSRRTRSAGDDSANGVTRTSRKTGHASHRLGETEGVLPDTCIWIEFFRDGRSKAAEKMDRLLQTSSLYTCGPVLYELLQGIRSSSEKSAVLDNLSGVEYVEMTRDTWIAAAALSQELRASGTTIPFSDIIIAALCMQYKLAICSEDSHFRSIRDLEHFTN